ncbi:MAG TPA: hypothetical protein VH877_15470 [Polyangia bacterium]|jgi:hypothetical protein|nr:hypothetical protein [Polyangia bacterium]
MTPLNQQGGGNQVRTGPHAGGAREDVVRCWTDEEPGLREVLAQLGRLWRRAWRRRGWWLVVSLVVTTVITVWRLRRPPEYHATVIYRIVEGPVAPVARRKTLRSLYLYGHIRRAAFTPDRLAELIRTSPVFPPSWRKNPLSAAADVLGDFELHLFRNFFFDEGGDPVERSARVALNYHGRDPELVYEVTRELGRWMEVAHQTSRLAELEAQSKIVSEAHSHASVEVYRRAQEVAEFQAQMVRQVSFADWAALNDARRHLSVAQQQAHDFAMRDEYVQFQLELERHRLVLQFQLLDAGQPERRVRTRDRLKLALIIWVLLLPLAGLAVAVLDPRIYDVGDVRHLGLPLLGAVPVFVGVVRGDQDPGLLKDMERTTT